MKKIFFLVSVVAVLFASCGAEKPIVTYSQQITKTNANDLMFRFYDSKTKIRYDFRNDDSLLYIIMETNNRPSQMRMFRNGVKIYLSALPKKDETRFVQYPIPSNEAEHHSEDGENNHQGGGGHHRGGGDQSHNLASIGKLATWNENGQSQTFLVGIDKVGFGYDLNYDKDGYFHYEIQIAKSKLKMNVDTTTVIGINIPTLEIPQSGGGGGGRGGSGGMGGGGMSRGGGMGGGGGMGRGGMGGGSGMRGGGGRTYDSSMEGADEKINWWFQLKVK